IARLVTMLVLPTPPLPLVTAIVRRRGRDGGGGTTGLDERLDFPPGARRGALFDPPTGRIVGAAFAVGVGFDLFSMSLIGRTPDSGCGRRVRRASSCTPGKARPVPGSECIEPQRVGAFRPAIRRPNPGGPTAGCSSSDRRGREARAWCPRDPQQKP